jgi:hypothetical protein
VHLHNNTGVQLAMSVARDNERLSIVLEAAQLGRDMARADFGRSIRSGYGDASQSLQRTYGLRRRV